MAQAVNAVLFDLDGVVVFTDKYHYLGWKKLSDGMGWDFNEEVNHGCRGVPRMASLEVILKHNNVTDLSEEKKAELATRKNEYYKELLKGINDSDVYPGSVEFIKKIRSRGVKTGLCSSSKNARTVLDALKLEGLFDVVITGHDFKNPKPDPEIFLLASEKLGIAPEECLVFEDAESGVESALAGNMQCVGVGPAERLPKAKRTITKYEDIDVDDLIEKGVR